MKQVPNKVQWTTRKKAQMVAAVIVLAIVSAGLLFYRTQTIWVESPPYHRISEGTARTLVVVYSRTGNTLGAAKEIARFFDADMLQIEAPQYGRTIKGHLLASRHADEELIMTPIRHEPVDLSRYELIFLCSPTWWFRPAPPLWSFAERQDFAGKPAFLVMTGNSRYKEEFTGKFGALIETKNGKFLGKVFIRRGRFLWQKTSDEVREELHEALVTLGSRWPIAASNK